MGSRNAYVSIAVSFLLCGLIFSTAMARLPALQDGLSLSEGQLAVALVGLNGGAIAGLQIGAVLCRRVGSRAVLRAGLPLFCLLLAPVALAPTLPLLVTAFVASAAVNGVLDVAINANGVAVERLHGRVILSRLHALLTLGGVAGAVTGAAAARLGITVAPHFAAVAVLGAAVAVLTTRHLTTDEASGSPPSAPTSLTGAAAPGSGPSRPGVGASGPASVTGAAASGSGPSRPGAGASGETADLEAGMTARGHRAGLDRWPAAWVAGFGGLAFCVMLAEGSAHEWAAVHLRDLGGSDAVAAAGVALFLAAMTTGRLAGDHLRQRAGAAPLVRAAALLAATGLGLALALRDPLAGLAGYALLGLGLSVIFPVMLGEAAHRAAAGGGSPAGTVARISTIAYLGSFLGPGLIGVLATVTDLRTALLLPVATMLVAALGAGLLRRRVPGPLPGALRESGAGPPPDTPAGIR